jgi:EAL domain-containing protein (putative c-di-GMP-specific phosphodiesterase class I)/CheY-like chemotaxis protein
VGGPLRLRLLIADDDAAIRRMVSELVRDEPDLEVAGTAATGTEAVEVAERLRPDVALLDVGMPGGGVEAARAIAARSPGTRIVAYSGYGDAATVRDMLQAGAVGYAVKSGSIADLLSAIRRAAAVAPRRPREDAPAPHTTAHGVRVLIVHPDARVLDALAEAVDRLETANLIGLAQTGSHAVTLAATHHAQVALVAAGSGAARLAAELEEAVGGVAVIGVGVFRDHHTAEATAHERADRYCLDTTVRELLEREILEAAAAEGGAQRNVTLRLGAARRDRDSADRERVQELLRIPLAIALQPVVNIQGPRAVAGYEALARFPDARSPDVCFAEAHRCRLGAELELHAVAHALERLEELPAEAFLSVNVSPGVLMDARLDPLLAHVPADRVVLELTEHAPVRDYEALGGRLDALRARGLRIAVDDCGAGFASLRHVVLIAPDFLKLDVVLCREVRTPVRWAMARALAGFAAETGSIAVAEGVEHQADLDALVELGVPMAQGWLLGKPTLDSPSTVLTR